MNQLLFEGHLLVGIVASIIGQKGIHIVHKRLDWERIYRLSDYHRVANIVYLGILGDGEALPDRWRDLFSKRYREALMYQERLDDSIREVLACLDMYEIPCTVISRGEVRSLYPLPETSDRSPLRIILDSEDYPLAKGFLVDLGYETEEIFTGAGERLAKGQGLRIELYRRLPFRTAAYHKNVELILERAEIEEPYVHIRALGKKDVFLLSLATAAYRYVTDMLTVREVLDLYLLHKSCRETLGEEEMLKRLEGFRIQKLAEKILRISYMWFGNKEDTYFSQLPDEIETYDSLENRLLTKGILNREEDIQALGLEQMIKQEIEKERRKERRRLFKTRLKTAMNETRKKLRWAFPDYRYMSALYPAVERVPLLLPLFWMLRGLRLAWHSRW